MVCSLSTSINLCQRNTVLKMETISVDNFEGYSPAQRRVLVLAAGTITSHCTVLMSYCEQTAKHRVMTVDCRG